MVDNDGRVVAEDGLADQPFDIGRRRRQYNLQPRTIEQHGLRAVAVLGTTAAAQSVQHVKHHRHRDLTARHIMSVGGLVDDLRPGFKNKTGGADIDKWTIAGHSGTDAGRRHSRLGNGWIAYSVFKVFAQPVHQIIQGAKAKDITADHADPVVFGHAAMQTVDQRFGVGNLAHWSLPSAAIVM